MGETWITVSLLILFALVAWIVAKVFRGGAPTGESSSRADTFASGSGYGAENADTLRHKQEGKETVAADFEWDRRT